MFTKSKTNFETLIPSLLDTTVKAFKNGAKEVANNILMNLIFSLNEKNEALKKQLFELDTEPTIATSMDTPEFHEAMINAEDMLEKLLYVSKEYKDKSEIFTQTL